MERVYSIDSIQLAILESFPPKLQISVKGQALTPGWQNIHLEPFIYIQAPPDGIYEFDFVADPPGPDVIVPQVISPIEAMYTLDPLPDDLIGVRVYASTNSQEALLQSNEQPAKK